MDPVLFSLPSPWGSVPIYTFGVFLGASILVGWYVVLHLGRDREGFDVNALAGAVLIGVVAGLVGARALFVLEHIDQLEHVGEAFRFDLGGLSAYGALALGGAALWVWARHKQLAVRALLDVAAVAASAGAITISAGAWPNGASAGAPLGVGAPTWLVRLGTSPNAAGESAPVHPVALYEAGLAIVLLAVVAAVYRRRPFAGAAFIVAAGGYALLRLGTATFRAESERVIAGASLAQIISIGVLAGALFFWRRWRPASPPERITAD